MNLKSLVNKQVVVQFKFALMLCGWDNKSKGIGPQTGRTDQGEQLIQVPFLIGMVRKDEGTEQFWFEIEDVTKAGSLLRIDVQPDLIAAVTSLEKEPSRLVM